MLPSVRKNYLHQIKTSIKGGLPHLPPKFEHIFVAVITSPPLFFCADIFDTSLLLIVCALR